MDTLPHILNGFVVAIQPISLLYVFMGVLMGMVVGVLPGIGPAAGIALLLPVTFGMDPMSALIMLAGVYYGAMYGGSLTSILLNTPGEASSVMTAIDGYKMARKGRAGAALAVAAIGSFIAGTISIVLLSVLARPLTSLALKFGPAEYFALMFFALTAISALTGKSLAKGLISGFLGLLLSTIGLDQQSGVPRYTMGITELQDGIDFIIVAVGVFAVAEVFRGIQDQHDESRQLVRIEGPVWLTREEWRQASPAIWRGSFIGFIVGVLPGAGATIASIMSYVTERRLSKHPERFGEGAIEGVAGPESANNAASTGAMVPLLTLGVPGSGTTAIILAAFIMYGIQPGPLLFQQQPDLVWGLINSMYVGNLILLAFNLPLIGLFARLIYLPTGILLPAILAIATVGVYATDTSLLSLYIAFGFGLVGYLFGALSIPLAPLVLALVLGGSMEQSFRRAMTISSGDPVIFFSSITAVVLMVAAIASITLPILLPRIARYRRRVAVDSSAL
jgi:putative tricarboxylic transport membrane protein